MSEFSYVLSRHVHGKNIKTYALAQYCGLDRSNMYKIINGKRKPTSLDMVHKMSKFMHLLPAEEKELEEAYQITLAGYDNYYRRKDVMDFFRDFHLPISSLTSFHYKTKTLKDNGLTILNSPTEIKQALFHVISDETSKYRDGHIRLLIQPDATFLMNLISVESRTESNLHIEHIICLHNNSETTHSQKNYNLNCLKQVLPLYGSCRNYECYYYYDNITARTGDFTLFPYMIITSRYVCLLTAHFNKGYLISSDASLQMFFGIFSEYRHASTALLHHIENVSDQLNYVESLLRECDNGYCFQMTPCFTPFLTLAHMEKYIRKDLPDRPAFMEQFQKYLKEIASHHEKGHLSCIFSFDGVKRFLQSGRIGEYPTELYQPFDLRDRIILVRKLMQSCKNTGYRMLKNSVGNPEQELYLFVNPQNGYLMFPSPYNGHPVYLNIEEPGLLFTFYDFCENLDNDMFYTIDETVVLLNHLIEELAKEIS